MKNRLLPSRRELLRFGAMAAVGGAAPFSLGAAPNARPVRTRVDAQGVWRWPDGSEVSLFGVNYALASAAAFRNTRLLNIDFDQTIAADFAHFERLGFDGLRLCFWGDWENSQADGQLIENMHLEVLDKTIAVATQRGMHCLLSPIVTYDSFWPDAMEQPRSGLASAFKKEVLGTDPAAIAAQARYLRALMSRTNTVTGRRYADEPAIIAVETINEPWHHSQNMAGSVRYIDALISAVREAGYEGPTFYNVTQDMGIAPAIGASKADGATFAWYPTGLQPGYPVKGNGLLTVTRYSQFDDPALAAKARLVYEFDAAATMASYLYPAMVREFRRGGAQFAAIFAYDPVSVAASNIEMNDHYLNLAYTPAKAVSAMIAGITMKQSPRGKGYGAYPENMAFAGVRVDDRQDLSEFRDATRLFHSNDTASAPLDPAALSETGGCGSSAIVTYDGTGAWFLDRIEPGVWRLTIYPDAAQVDNPFRFRRASLPVTRIIRRRRRLTIRLPDLGERFLVSRKGAADVVAAGGSVVLEPGVYRLSAKPTTREIDATFFAPAGEDVPTMIVHDAPRSRTAGRPWQVEAQVIGSQISSAVTLHVRTAKDFVQYPMRAGRGFSYSCTLPGEAMVEGFVDYYIVARDGDGAHVVPDAGPRLPGDFDFPDTGGLRVPVVADGSPLWLYDAARNGDDVIVPYGRVGTVPGVAMMPTPAGGTALRLDPGALGAAPFNDLPVQSNWNGALDGEGRDLGLFTAVEVHGACLNGPSGPVSIMLIERDGTPWGTTIQLKADGAPVRISLKSLRVVQTALLPREYPKGITPYWIDAGSQHGGTGDGPDLANLQGVQITLAQRFAQGPQAAVAITGIALVA